MRRNIWTEMCNNLGPPHLVEGIAAEDPSSHLIFFRPIVLIFSSVTISGFYLFLLKEESADYTEQA